MKSCHLLAFFVILMLKHCSITQTVPEEGKEIIANQKNSLSKIKAPKLLSKGLATIKLKDEAAKIRFKSMSNMASKVKSNSESNLNSLNKEKSQAQALNQNQSQAKTNSSSKSTAQTGNKVAITMNTKSKDDPSSLWNQLFNQERESICRKKKSEEQTANLEGKEIKRGERVFKGSFNWIKKWGFGPTAYLIDYLDCIFLNDIVKDFKKVFSEIKAFSNKDNEVYEDVFDLRKLDPTNKITDLKKLNPNYEPGVYENSVNSVQIDTAMRKWGWFKVEGENSAKQFIIDYDMNGDGRLTPRELFLGLIMHHKDKKLLCYNCFLLLKKKLAAMFEYFDCVAEGFITAEDLWRLLPQLNRKDGALFNIFGIANENNIRTDAVNDFVIKNGESRPGFIAKEEFVNGILLAYWDRQTDDRSIFDDDFRSLRKLRWSSDKKTDTVAFLYMKDKELAEALEKEERQKEKNLKAEFQNK